MRIYSYIQPYDKSTLGSIERYISCFLEDNVLIQRVNDGRAELIESKLFGLRPSAGRLQVIFQPEWFNSGGSIVSKDYCSRKFEEINFQETRVEENYKNDTARITIGEHHCLATHIAGLEPRSGDILRNQRIFEDVERIKQWDNLFKNGKIFGYSEAMMGKYLQILSKYGHNANNQF